MRWFGTSPATTSRSAISTAATIARCLPPQSGGGVLNIRAAPGSMCQHAIGMCFPAGNTRLFRLMPISCLIGSVVGILRT